MAKPIQVLLDHFFQSLAGIAPERATELMEIVTKKGIKFEVKDTEEPFFFFANPNKKTITAGVGALGRLWATAYGYYCLYTTVAEAKREDLAIRELSLKSDERMAKASTLLEWAIDAEYKIAKARKAKEQLPSIPWPDDLPKPVKNPVPESDEHVADELFLAAGAYVLHHELAHLRLDQEPSDDPAEMRRLEMEADEAAAAWLLRDLDENDPRFLKRMMGIALALCWLTSVAVFVPEDTRCHPPSCVRLHSTVDSFVSDDNHLIWAFVDTILRANLESRRMQYDQDREAASFKDDVEYCINVIGNFES
jgi:hypothetical protein